MFFWDNIIYKETYINTHITGVLLDFTDVKKEKKIVRNNNVKITFSYVYNQINMWKLLIYRIRR